MIRHAMGTDNGAPRKNVGSATVRHACRKAGGDALLWFAYPKGYIKNGMVYFRRLRSVRFYGVALIRAAHDFAVCPRGTRSAWTRFPSAVAT